MTEFEIGDIVKARVWGDLRRKKHRTVRVIRRGTTEKGDGWFYGTIVSDDHTDGKAVSGYDSHVISVESA